MNPSQQRALSGNSSQFTDPPLKAAPPTSTTITQTQPLTSPLEVHVLSPPLDRFEPQEALADRPDQAASYGVEGPMARAGGAEEAAEPRRVA